MKKLSSIEIVHYEIEFRLGLESIAKTICKQPRERQTKLRTDDGYPPKCVSLQEYARIVSVYSPQRGYCLLNNLWLGQHLHRIDLPILFHANLETENKRKHLTWKTLPNDPCPIVFRSSKSDIVNFVFSFIGWGTTISGATWSSPPGTTGNWKWTRNDQIHFLRWCTSHYLNRKRIMIILIIPKW